MARNAAQIGGRGFGHSIRPRIAIRSRWVLGQNGRPEIRYSEDDIDRAAANADDGCQVTSQSSGTVAVADGAFHRDLPKPAA